MPLSVNSPYFVQNNSRFAGHNMAFIYGHDIDNSVFIRGALRGFAGRNKTRILLSRGISARQVPYRYFEATNMTARPVRLASQLRPELL